MRKARKIREAVRYSLREVEDKTGIDHSALGKFETGEHGMGIENLAKLAAFYGEALGRPVTIDELVAREEAEVSGG